MNDTWKKAQFAEAEFWGKCLNTYSEETKQLTIYAPRMKLNLISRTYIDVSNKSILDIGGGPSSLLLKCINRGRSMVIDPLPLPLWVRNRYREADIDFRNEQAEEYTFSFGVDRFDEVWIYNVLQHAQDPQLIIKNVRENLVLKTIRIFEWIEVPADKAHPHVLHAKDLDKWLGKKGLTEKINEYDSFTHAYYNVIHL